MEKEFKQYRRTGLSEMRPYDGHEVVNNLSISDTDKANGSPKVGDWIARNPKDHRDQWLVSEKYFAENLEEVREVREGEKANTHLDEFVGKSYQNTTSDGAKKNVKDIVFWGDGDMFKLISKAHSKKEQWMKSTKAMQIEGIGCVVQVTTQQGDNVAEALVFVPGVRILSESNSNGRVTSRKLIHIKG